MRSTSAPPLLLDWNITEVVCEIHLSALMLSFLILLVCVGSKHKVKFQEFYRNMYGDWAVEQQSQLARNYQFQYWSAYSSSVAAAFRPDLFSIAAPIPGMPPIPVPVPAQLQPSVSPLVLPLTKEQLPHGQSRHMLSIGQAPITANPLQAEPSDSLASSPFSQEISSGAP